MSRPREQGGLFKHINGYWYWRRTNPKTGLRDVRSTGMDKKNLAMRVAAKFDDEWEREAAGLQSYDWARRSLLELADEWLAEVKPTVEEKTGEQKDQLIHRALKDLNLHVVAELDDLAGLDRRLKRLMKRFLTRRLPPETLQRKKRGTHVPLSKWLNGGMTRLCDEHLERLDPGLIRPEEVRRLRDEHRARTRDHTFALWGLVVLSAWMERYRVQGVVA